MRIGSFYKLESEVKSECQGHHFVYPAGTILRLEDVYDRDLYKCGAFIHPEDGRVCTSVDRTGTERVYSFETVPQGYALNVVATAVAPATAEEVKAAAPGVQMTPPAVSSADFYGGVRF
jgi:hypothetical protein